MMPSRGGLAVATVLVALTLACNSGGAGGGGGPTQFSSELLTEADFPLALTFAPDGRLFYNERYTGNVRIVSAEGELQREPLVTVENLALGAEWGLIGLTLDPDFEQNHYFYLYYTESVQKEPAKIAHPLVVRYTEVDGRGADPLVLVEDIPNTDPEKDAGAHVAGNLRFGPRGYLRITIGEMEVADDAHDPSTLRGAIIRIDPETGEAAPDNPLIGDANADPRVYAYGFRNPFQFEFRPQTGEAYIADNGPFKCDRLVRVVPGADYGWPDLDAICEGEGPTVPVYLFALPDLEGTDTSSNVGPAGLEFVEGDTYGGLDGSLLACEWNTGFMRRLVLNDEGTEVSSDDVILEDCKLDITQAPDGTIYYSNETEIRRLVEK